MQLNDRHQELLELCPHEKFAQWHWLILQGKQLNLRRALINRQHHKLLDLSGHRCEVLSADVRHRAANNRHHELLAGQILHQIYVRFQNQSERPE